LNIRTEVFSVGDNNFGFKVYINHSHNKIDFEVIDSEVCDGETPTATLTPWELKILANKLINLDYGYDRTEKY